ncbi:MAG: hypothetical protein ACOX81_02325 [Candidatus Heteroscillospira sp.]|jgi:hypothetical protein
MKRLAAFCFAVFLCILPLSTPVSANAAERPALTVIVSGAPEDFELSLKFGDGSIVTPRMVGNRIWQTYFRFFHSDYPRNTEPVSLLIRYNGQVTEKAGIPEFTKSYNNAVTLNLRTGELCDANTPMRKSILIASRVGFTMLGEGLVFYYFGYRTRRSWLVFMAANLITQGWLNYVLYNINYAQVALFFLEFIVVIAELALFLPVSEHSYKRTSCYILAGNAASFLLGLLILSGFPI